jgi:hypothetical protein
MNPADHDSIEKLAMSLNAAYKHSLTGEKPHIVKPWWGQCLKCAFWPTGGTIRVDGHDYGRCLWNGETVVDNTAVAHSDCFQPVQEIPK